MGFATALPDLQFIMTICLTLYFAQILFNKQDLFHKASAKTRGVFE